MVTPAASGDAPRRRGPRRAQAAATRDGEAAASATPDADWTRWFAQRAEGDDARPLSAREAWFVEQRPPHWD